MLIEIQELETHPIDFREVFSPGAIDLGPDLRQLSPLRSEGHADLVEEHHGKHKVIQDIRLKGKLETSLEVACARCLEPVVHEVRHDFDLLYRPLGSDAGHEELSVTDAEAEIGYYQGEGVLLEDALREQVLLAVPDERLRWFVHRHLGPIAHRDDLLRTLDCWLATGGSRQAVSERLHLHRNSVGYRVGLIKRLLGVDPLDPQTVAVLRTALAARELLAASEAG